MGGDLHALSLEDIEDVALGGRSDVQPDTGQQAAQRAASREVGAAPDVQPPPQHLGAHRQSTEYMLTFLNLWAGTPCGLVGDLFDILN